MMVGRNLRQLGEPVARGKSAISIGVSYYTYLPFIKAGLPVKSISNIKEGYYAGTGSGNLAVLKNQAHPNAAKVFVNWLLVQRRSDCGHQGFRTADAPFRRRYQVDERIRPSAAKEVLRRKNSMSWKTAPKRLSSKFRKPAMQLAEKLFK